MSAISVLDLIERVRAKGLYAQMFNRFGMPSFVSTLSGLLAILGAQLYILGSTGSINLPYESPLVDLGQSLFMPAAFAYLVVALAGVVMFVTCRRRCDT